MVLEWTRNSPYLLLGGLLVVEADGKIKVQARTHPTRDWRDIPLEPTRPQGARQQWHARARPLIAESFGTRTWQVRVTVDGRDAAIHRLRQSTTFQHNMYSQPQLMPGRNEVTVTADNPDALVDGRLVAEIVWQQQGKTHRVRRTIDQSPFRFVVNVAGARDELPRMKWITLENRRD
jgi:hypothetical protein